MDDISLVWYNERISMNAIISRKQVIACNQVTFMRKKSKKFLERENIKAHNAETTRNCKEGCSGCGVKKECGGVYCG